MSKFSVKKPFTILVMVLVIIMLGVVSVTRMQMDLLPEFSLPYVLIITTYPGASPEKVESTICEPMESALGTISGVENVYSIAYENYGMVELEFADGTNMDSIMVKVSTALDTVKDNLPEECGTPSVMELSMDMMASQYLAVAYEGMSMEELSRFVEDNVVPELERQNGVASISKMGLIDQTIHVELNQEKVDDLNNQILGIANDAFEEAMEDLEDAKQQLEDSEEQMAESRQELIDAQQELDDGRQELIDAQQDLEDGKQELIDGQEELDNGHQQLADGRQELEDGRQELEDARDELEDTRTETYEQLAQASQALEALETYKAELVAQQATMRALEAAISACMDPATLNQIEAGIQGLNNAKTCVDNAINSTGADFDNNLPIALEALGQLGFPTKPITDLTGNINDQKTLLSEYSIQIQNKINELTTTRNDLNSRATTYTNQKTSLELEMQVTRGIISGYEQQLDSMGIDYTDIEEAKMEAATAFATAEAQLNAGESQLDAVESQLDATEEQLNSAQDQLDAGWDQLADAQEQIDSGLEQLEEGQQQIDDGWEQLADGEEQLEEGWESYYDGLVQFEKQRREALRSANADQLLSLSTLSGIIYAQNFEMPAGYLDDAEDNSWLLKVGNNFRSMEELENLVLCNIEDVGDVRLCDVADITIVDNAGTTYTKLDGNSAIILSLFKSSTTGTNEVSKICKSTIESLQEKYDGLSIMIMMDQGDYITLIVDSVVQNMVIGAALAILILAIFLRDFMPTIVVAISIPLSVLTALVAMYFSGISLNMMTLSGMALGIGMLVDNSIVVIENIYRLRGRGMEAPRAAVQGTKQVAGAVLSSTLTTVCVFFPLVYTSGMTRELMLPMALTIIFCLMASLFIAMTVVPASASTLLRNTKPKSHKIFDKIQDIYGKSLEFCLRVKIVPLLIAVALLFFSIWKVVQMGIVMIPSMTSNEISAVVNFDEETPRETAYGKMDELLARVQEIEGVGTVGTFAGGGESLMISTGEEETFLSYSIMVKARDENASSAQVRAICREMNSIAEELEIELITSTGMEELSTMLGNGLAINIYGNDMDKLLQASEEVMAIIDSVEGFTEISNGQEDAAQVLHLNVDKNYAMSQGLSVAQIYQNLAGEMTTTQDSISVTIDGAEMDIEIIDEMEPLTVDNLMDYTFPVTKEDEDGISVTTDIPLSDLAELELQDGVNNINRKNQTRYLTVSASVEDGYNTTLLSRELLPLLEAYELPEGITLDLGGETEAVNEMLEQMILMMVMGLAFIYFVMVAQFQSLLSPFIILFTVPLAFTGGLLALWITGENLSVISLMGLVVLLGTVVNNGIVFVDYTNQLRMGGMSRRAALVATGKTRMRPILMTAMTTILAEATMIFGDDMASQMGKGMALVIAGGLSYATLMTLYIIPVVYDILFKKQPLNVDIGSENLDDVPDDAKEFMEEMRKNGMILDDEPKKKSRRKKKKGNGEEIIAAGAMGDGALIQD
ncbi:MAG: efflux RND transporter permease subunit, partial [Lachnospiraceae bacterium]